MISVIIPAYNEEASIAETVHEVSEVLNDSDRKDFEILVVDDGSDDGTGPKAQAAGAKVIRNIQNVGYGFSLKTGITAAKYDIIVISDADGTYPLDRIPALLNRYEEGFKMVVGARTGKYFRDTLIKGPLRTLLKWLVEFTAGRRIPDVNSGLRVFSKSDAMPYFGHLSDSFSFTTSITLAYMLEKKSVEYIPVPYNKRVGESKVRLFHDSLRTLQYIVQAILYYNPLKIFIVLAFGTIAFGIAVTLAGIIFSIPALLWFGALSILVAAVIFSLGLLADLLRQIMIKTRAD